MFGLSQCVLGAQKAESAHHVGGVMCAHTHIYTSIFCCRWAKCYGVIMCLFGLIINVLPCWFHVQLLQQLKRLICDLCRLYNLPQHPDVEMLDQPLPAGPITQDRKVGTKNKNENEWLFMLVDSHCFHSTIAWTIRRRDIWRGRGGRNGRGAYTYYSSEE